MTFDPDAYRDYLAALDLSEEQETAMLTSLWELMTIVTDVALGQSYPQEIPEHSPCFAALEAADAVESNQDNQSKEAL